MDASPTPAHMTTRQAATLLLVSRATTATYLRRGWLDGQRIGRAWRVEAASVQRLLRCGHPAR